MNWTLSHLNNLNTEKIITGIGLDPELEDFTITHHSDMEVIVCQKTQNNFCQITKEFQIKS